MKPAWLPNILTLDGTWENTLAKLYSIFDQDFIQAKPTFNGRPIWWDQRILDGRYEEGFWHIISEKDWKTQERIPDFERAKRLPWCAAIITHSIDPAVKFWDYKESDGSIRTYVWLEQWDYVVILEKRQMRLGEVAFLITAYHVSGSSSRKKHAMKYDQRVSDC
jgi:hypothetical protein